MPYGPTNRNKYEQAPIAKGPTRTIHEQNKCTYFAAVLPHNIHFEKEEAEAKNSDIRSITENAENPTKSRQNEKTLTQMEVTRVFHPVGQGGFYTETFETPQPLMVVYDCGGNSIKSMEDYLQSFLGEGKNHHINTAMFISHLHFDHINGLKYLLDHARVSRLFLPQLTRGRIIETLLYNAVNFSQNDSEYVNNLIADFGSRRYDNVTYVRPAEEIPNDSSIHNIDSTPPYILSGSHVQVSIGSDNQHWVYIPYNPKSEDPDFSSQDNDVQGLKVIYENTSEDLLSQEMASFVKELTCTELAALYKKLFGGIHNAQSMALFSGLLECDRMVEEVKSNLLLVPCGCFHDYDRYYYRHCMHEGKIPCNFLYTGDYENISKNSYPDIRLFYGKLTPNVWKTVCGIQIPHHGSRKNYYQRLYDNMCFAIASVGVNNRYLHPNVDTLINIYGQGCMPIVVTEDINTLRYQQFVLY